MQIEAGGLNEAAGIGPAVVAGAQHGFVAGVFTFDDQPRADPPHQRVEPEHGLDQGVKAGGEVVATAQVAGLMGQDGVDLRTPQTFGEGLRHDQDRPQQTDQPWLHQ